MRKLDVVMGLQDWRAEKETVFIQDSDLEGAYWICRKCKAQFDFGGDKPSEQEIYYCPKCGREITAYL